ncbi:MAG TPA: TetR family transcriptional regulator [Actinomycetota bacterium]|nr:TetR family transcriptional regulator [Actinomycetota bacterium]
MTDPGAAGLRERKKARTRRAIQEQAMRLFLAKGYATTTVQEIAAAAGVSHMTFFRYFPTKEDVVMADEYDPLIMELVRARPAGEPDVERIRHALLAGLTAVSAADRQALLDRTRLVLGTPALRARLWENQVQTEALLLRALGPDGGEEAGLQRRVLVAGCLAAVTTALLVWVERDGKPDLPGLVEQAFGALRAELAAS